MASSTNRVALMKQKSRAQIIMAVRKYGPISRVRLGKQIGFSLSHIGSIVDELLEEGVLIETGISSTPRGRPMVLLDINPNGAPVAGVLLSCNASQIVVASPTGEFLARRSIQQDKGASPESVILTVAQGIQRCAEAAKVDIKSLSGIGVSVAGQVDPILGLVSSLAGTDDWDGIPIVRLLQSRLGVPVYIDSDINAGALADQLFGENVADGGVLYVLISSRIRSALVHNDEVFRGVHGFAGQLAHVVVDPEGPICECGNRGCLEAMASDRSFVRYLQLDDFHGSGEGSPTDSNAFFGLSTGGEFIGSRRKQIYLPDNDITCWNAGVGDRFSSDLDASFTLSFGGPSWCAGIAYRQSESECHASSGYFLYFTSNGQYAVLSSTESGKHTEISRVETSPWINWAEVHSVRVRSIANHHEVWIDDNKIMSVVDETKLSGGFVSLVRYNGWAYFDNLNIRSAGHSSASITGKVIDCETGEAIAGAVVHLNACQSTTTLADGTYSFTDLAPGTYKVAVYDDTHYVANLSIKIDDESTLAKDFALTRIPSATYTVKDSFSREDSNELGVTEDNEHLQWIRLDPDNQSIAKGKLVLADQVTIMSERGPSLAGFDSADLDVTFKASIRIVKTGSPVWDIWEQYGIAYRNNAPNLRDAGGYSVQFCPNQNKVFLVRNPPFVIVTSADVTGIDWSQENTLRVRAVGPRHQAWINGMLLFDVLDSANLDNGYVTLFRSFGTAYFDDLEIQPLDMPVMTITGRVFDGAASSNPVSDARVTVTAGNTIVEGVTDKTGNYTLNCPVNYDFDITVTHKDYCIASLPGVSPTSSKRVLVDIPMVCKPPQPGDSISSNQNYDDENIGKLLRDGLELAVNGDVKASEALATTMGYLGLGLANAVNLFDPRAVLIGGTIVDVAPDMVMHIIRQKLVEYASVNTRNVELRPVSHYEDFLLRGSIGLVLWQPCQLPQEDSFSLRSL